MSADWLQLAALGVNAILVLVIVPLRSAIESLKQSDDRLSQRIQALELKVAEHYVQRSELSNTLLAISQKLDRIEARLEGKIEALEREKVSK